LHHCQPIARAVRHSTERWDGGGTPHGLSENAIPLPARLIGLARVLVGPVDVDVTPTWPARCGRARALSGTILDPSLVAPAIAAILEAPPAGPLFSMERALAALDALVCSGTRACADRGVARCRRGYSRRTTYRRGAGPDRRLRASRTRRVDGEHRSARLHHSFVTRTRQCR
jgi:hypothetical protein